MKTIQLTEDIGENAALEMQGEFAKFNDCDLMLGQEEIKVLTPEGNLLLSYVRNAYSAEVAQQAFRVFNEEKFIFHGSRNNRGNASGRNKSKDSLYDGTLVSGAKTNTDYNTAPTQSGTIGYFERVSRFPYCRPTAFNTKYPQDWEKLIPFFQRSDLLYSQLAPEKYAEHLAEASLVLPEWKITGTVFSTATINSSYRTAYHRDAGNIKSGLACMALFGAGQFSGGELVFPRYRFAIKLASNSFITFAAQQEVHGNLAILGKPKEFKRLSIVMYTRAGMQHCLLPEEEIIRVQNRKVGTPLNAN